MGRASFSISRKLKEVKNLIKAWNKESFGRLEINKKLAVNQLEDWDRLEEERGLTEEESEVKKEAKDMYKKWKLLEEMHWRQKSREFWLGGGGGLDIQVFFIAWPTPMCTFTKTINTIFLVLIPKKGGAESNQKKKKKKERAKDLKDFRPISLVRSLYKLLAKRLKKVVGKVLSEAQNAFVEGCQITNASLIANEVIDYW